MPGVWFSFGFLPSFGAYRMILRIVSLTALLVVAAALVCDPIQMTNVRAQALPSVRTIELTFTTIDCPGEDFTFLYGINSAGDMVGRCQDSGLLYRGGTFTLIDYPGNSFTDAWGINDSGLIVGSTANGNSPESGYSYDGTTFKDIRAPGARETRPLGVNNAGAVVGTTQPRLGVPEHGFAMIGTRGQKISPPGTNRPTWVSGINNLKQMVGDVSTSSSDEGFLYAHGNYQRTDFPDAVITDFNGINDNGIVVGYSWANSCQGCGFAFKDGKFLSFTYPGALFTVAQGINNSGQIVGWYEVDDTHFHGFVTSPLTLSAFTEHADSH